MNARRIQQVRLDLLKKMAATIEKMRQADPDCELIENEYIRAAFERNDIHLRIIAPAIFRSTQMDQRSDPRARWSAVPTYHHWAIKLCGGIVHPHPDPSFGLTILAQQVGGYSVIITKA